MSNISPQPPIMEFEVQAQQTKERNFTNDNNSDASHKISQYNDKNSEGNK